MVEFLSLSISSSINSYKAKLTVKVLSVCRLSPGAFVWIPKNALSFIVYAQVTAKSVNTI